jgi:Lysozyme like domain
MTTTILPTPPFAPLQIFTPTAPRTVKNPFPKPVYAGTWQVNKIGRAYVTLHTLQEAGFRGKALREMTAVWLAESNAKRHAINTANNDGKPDVGPAQIHSPLTINGTTVDSNGQDWRTYWHWSAKESFQLWTARGFQPWHAHGTQNWVNQFPFVDAAITWLEPEDKTLNEYLTA